MGEGFVQVLGALLGVLLLQPLDVPCYLLHERGVQHVLQRRQGRSLTCQAQAPGSGLSCRAKAKARRCYLVYREPSLVVLGHVSVHLRLSVPVRDGYLWDMSHK